MYMTIIDAIDKNEVIAFIDMVCNSTEDKWVKFRANNGSKGVTEYILNHIEHMPSTHALVGGRSDSNSHKESMGGFNPW